MSMSVEIQRQLNTIIQRNDGSIEDLVVIVNHEVLNRFKKEDSKILVELERTHSGRLTFRTDANMHRENFIIADAKTEKTLFQP